MSPDPHDDDKLHEECGVFGIFGHDDATPLTALGLHALQHRGQEACGIVSHDGEHFYSHRALGLVGSAFKKQRVINALPGRMAIGHNRYATTGVTEIRNVQPLYADLAFGGFAIAHNGNLTNPLTIRQELVKQGAVFRATSDTEVIIHLMAMQKKGSAKERMIEALKQIHGAYSIVAMAPEMMMAVRDPHGIRPLVMGRLDNTTIIASETCALDIIGADYIRDIEPGEMVVITKEGVQSFRPFDTPPSRFCIFEYVYFARPDSMLEGRSVYEVRKKIGAELAKESPCNADIVVPVPDSGIPSAIGYAQESGIPFDLGIIRNHYIGRTFIEPTDGIRNLGVRLKHNANRAYIEGRKVVLVDDSIVRGTTSRKIVEMIRAAGAKEVHMRIASPPTAHSCFYGIDTPTEGKLIANQLSIEGIAEDIGVDSLAYISPDGLYRAVGEEKRNASQPQFCDACFTGDYAVPLIDHWSDENGDNVSYLKSAKKD